MTVPDPATPPRPARCATCGRRLSADYQFCPGCGSALAPATRQHPVPAGAPAYALTLLDDAGQVVRRYPLPAGETSIGRAGADLEFPEDAFLSPVHAMITVRDERIAVRDLGSRNGTWRFITEFHRLADDDRVLVGSQILQYRRLGYPGPHPPERDATRRTGSLVPPADIACLVQLRADGSARDVLHLSPGRTVILGRERGHWIFPYDASMSAAHAEIRSEDADFVIVDLGSRNGVAVAVRSEEPFARGTRILAGTRVLRVEHA